MFKRRDVIAGGRSLAAAPMLARTAAAQGTTQGAAPS